MQPLVPVCWSGQSLHHATRRLAPHSLTWHRGRFPMPVVDYGQYCEMLDRARKGKFAYPAINVTSLTTANAVLKGLADSKSDGIIQVSTGGGAFASGAAVKDMALGAISIPYHVHRVADRYPIYVALHTDHCQKDRLDAFVLPRVEETERLR